MVVWEHVGIPTIYIYILIIYYIIISLYIYIPNIYIYMQYVFCSPNRDSSAPALAQNQPAPDP